MRTCLVISALCAALAACGSDGFPAPHAEQPEAPSTNDPAFSVRAVKEWYLVGNPATPGDDLFTVVVEVPAGTDFVDAWIGDLPVTRLSAQPDGTFATQVSIADLPGGEYSILLAANGSNTAFARVPFRRSAPYYVLVTTDWDFSDPSDQAIAYQNALHQNHPGMRLTHFVGPYTFTDPEVTPARQAELVTWLVKMRTDFHDEIGLHIHPYCHFVEAAGVTCNTTDSTVYAGGDLTGYTIKLGAYDRANMGKLLDKSIELFQAHGLNRPKTFRAGGWTATLDTLNALADKGFTADTSALNWALIEEWDGVQNGELFRWNMMQWGSIGNTSQPYYVNQTDILSGAAPTISLLEVPDNGAMIDYTSVAELTGIFDANWNGQPLATPVTLMMGFHPALQFSLEEYRRVDEFLKHADPHLATKHAGPVVYITLDELVAAYPH